MQMSHLRTAQRMNPLMVEMIDAYIADRTALGEYSERTATTTRNRLYGFAAYTDALPWEVDRSIVKGWLASMEGIAPSTRALRYSSLRTFYNWACVEGRASQNPTLGVQRPKVPKGEPRYLTAREVDEVRAQCRASGKQRGTLMFWLMYGEGLRCEEVSRILMHDIDHEAGLLHVRGKGYGGERSRRVPMSPDTRKAMNEYLQRYPEITAGPLLRSKHDLESAMTAGTISELMSGYMRKAGVKREANDGVSAHALRHTAAEEMAANTPDIRIVQAFLGHENLATTQTYLRREVTGVADVQAARFAPKP